MKHNSKGRRQLLTVAACVAIAASPLGAAAQQSASIERFSPLAAGYLERARVMSKAGNYAGAIDQLKHLHTQNVTLSPAEREEYVYMLATAFYERGDSECIELLRAFVRDYPASPLALKARLAVGDFNFFKHNWADALAEYDEIDFGRLNRIDLPLYTYRYGLTLIKAGKYGEARPFISRLAQYPAYREAATFYNAYLEYVDGDLDDAYDGFSKVKSSEKGLEAAYYLTQIDYTRGDYETVAENGPSLLRRLDDLELAPELNRVTGLSLFKLHRYSEAKGYLQTYMLNAGDSAAPDAVYAMAVTEYEDGDYDAAAERFSTLTALNNDIAQSAWLYLGQCDVKGNNPDAAAIAFEKAARMSYDRNVSETALYNYAAAVTRGGKVPFTSSVDLLEGFLKSFPNSQYAPKVEEYLATAYYNERDYARALASIEKIRKPSAKVLAAKQKVLYELGIEAMTNGRAADAVKYLRQSIALASHDRALAVQSNLWLGDAQYSLGNYKEAQKAYSTFISGEKTSANRSLALYNLAYSLYQQENYRQAAREFDSAISARPALPQALLNDARIRRGDCLYYTGDYRTAQKEYDKALDANAADADYASYRHAVMLGLGGNIKGKIAELSAMPQKFPGSRWLPNALLEKAQTFEALDRRAEAAKAYEEVAASYPRSAQARKAMVNLAITRMKAGDSEKGAEVYREIIRNWPSSEEASIANEDLRKYYAANGGLQEYASFLRSVPGARQLDAGEMEKLAFDGAETAYADNADNILLLQNYVRDYPDGKYLAPALLDIASSQRAAGKYTEAVANLDMLTSRRQHSAQYAEALLMKAEILENEIPGEERRALEAYKELERSGSSEFLPDAYAGIMRTTTDSNEKIAYARKTRQAGGVSAELAEEASLIEAQALLENGRDSEAISMLENLAANPSGIAGAKAAVTLGEHYLARKDYKNAEKVLLEFTDAGTPHQYWLAKGFISLADAYRGQGKTHLAKEYLQSLKENYPGKEKDIISSINTRLKSWK